MTRIALTTSALATRPQPPRGLGRTLLALLALRRSRRMLAGLEEHRLRDLGLSREDALAEARRPFWNAPDYWLR